MVWNKIHNGIAGLYHSPHGKDPRIHNCAGFFRHDFVPGRDIGCCQQPVLSLSEFAADIPEVGCHLLHPLIVHLLNLPPGLSCAGLRSLYLAAQILYAALNPRPRPLHRKQVGESG
jgi:hypothetical protein